MSHRLIPSRAANEQGVNATGAGMLWLFLGAAGGFCIALAFVAATLMGVLDVFLTIVSYCLFGT